MIFGMGSRLTSIRVHSCCSCLLRHSIGRVLPVSKASCRFLTRPGMPGLEVAVGFRSPPWTFLRKLGSKGGRKVVLVAQEETRVGKRYKTSRKEVKLKGTGIANATMEKRKTHFSTHLNWRREAYLRWPCLIYSTISSSRIRCGC